VLTVRPYRTIAFACMLVACASGGTRSDSPTHSIRGTISGVPGPDQVTVALAGPLTISTSPATDGTYSFNGLPDGSYTVTPQLAGLVFAPSSISVTLSGADAMNRDFRSSSSTSTSQTISGTVSGGSVGGLTIKLTGESISATATTDGAGLYNFGGIVDGLCYSITPLPVLGYIFDPAWIGFCVDGGNLIDPAGEPTNLNMRFVPLSSTHTISGTVTGDVVSGVSLYASAKGYGATATTDTAGHFAFSQLPDDSYSVWVMEVPVDVAKELWTVTPSQNSVTLSGADTSGLNFTVTAHPYRTISGTISTSPSPVTVTVWRLGPIGMIGGSPVQLGSTVTNSAGQYSFNYGVIDGYQYSIEPSLASHSFDPSDYDVPVNGADVSGLNFLLIQ